MEKSKNNLQKYVKTSDKYGKLKKGASNHDLLWILK